MTLNELMAESDHEVYFCVVTPDKEEHIFLSSDYHGAHPDVMPELEPLLGCEVGDYELVIRDDPEKPDVFNADKVPMMWVPLLEDHKPCYDMTDDEFANFIEKSDAVKNMDKDEFFGLLAKVEELGTSGLVRCLSIVKSISESMKSLKLRSKMLQDRANTDQGEEGAVAKALKLKLEKALKDLRERGSVVSKTYMEIQKKVVDLAVKSAEEFDRAFDGRRNHEASTLELLSYEIETSLATAGSDIKLGKDSRLDQIEILGNLLKEVVIAADQNVEEAPEDVKKKIESLDEIIADCLDKQLAMPKTCTDNVEKSLENAQEKLAETLGKLKEATKDDGRPNIRKLVDRLEIWLGRVDFHGGKLRKALCDKLERELLTTKVSLCRERKKPLEKTLAKIKESEERNPNSDYVEALKWAYGEIRRGCKCEKKTEEGIESLISSMESIKGRMPRIQQSVIDSLETVISAKLKSIEAAGYGSAEIEAVEKVLKVLSEKQKKMRADLKQMPKCTLASKARYVAFEEQIKEIARNASKLSGFLEFLRNEASLNEKGRISALKSLASVLKADGEVLVNADSAIKWLKQNRRIFT